MNILSKLVLGAAFSFAATNATAQAEEFMHDHDNAVITIKRTISNGDTTYSAISKTPDLMEYNAGTLDCVPGSLNGRTLCKWYFTLKTDYTGVPFGLYPPVTWTTPYGYVHLSTATTAEIDVTIEAGPIHLGDIMRYPSTNINNPGAYIHVSNSQDAQSKASVQPGYDNLAHKVIYAEMPIIDISGATELYQDFQILGSGIKQDISLIENKNLVNAGYEATSTNKGQFIGTWPGSIGYQWYLSGWNTGSGHYADWKLFTNGTSKNDPGLDLSDFSTIELAINCFTNPTIEVFFGTGDDSSQNYLGDISCDQTEILRTYDISGYNASDIQTALWLHIPTWKNAHMSQSTTLDMNISILNIKK